MVTTAMNSMEWEWKKLARRTALRVGLCRVMHRVGPCAIVAGVLSLILGIAGRQFAWSFAAPLSLLPALLILVVPVALSIALRPGKFIDPAEGIVRLELILGLNNTLTTALAGRGPWPPLPARRDDLLRFEWRRILTPFVICAALAAAGMLIPLPADAASGAKMPPPRSHQDIAAAIAELDKAGAVRKEDLEQVQRQLDEIRGQPPEDWYSHSSLEAADHLKAGLQEQMREMARQLAQAQASLGALEAGMGSMSAAEQQRLAGEFKSALQGLKRASPGLNEKLMSALSKVDPSNLRSLSKTDLENMLNHMKSAAGACKNCSGGNCGGKSGSAGDALDELNDLLGDSGKQRSGTGQGDEGGIRRGPGVAPLPLSNIPTDLDTQNPESVNAGDLSRSRPGDVIGTEDTEHQLDKAPAGPQASGIAGSSGRGGEAVWRDALMPREKAVLQKYFK